MANRGYASVLTRAIFGVDAPQISVEVHISNGLPAFHLVGLPEASVRESKERVRSAIINSQLEFPSKRITVHLAPADLPKSGGRYDLAIAVGILIASQQLPPEQVAGYEFIAELSLSGQLAPVAGLLPCVHALTRQQHQIVCAQGNVAEAQIVSDAKILAAESLLGVYLHLMGQQKIDFPEPSQTHTQSNNRDDLTEVIGHQTAKRALVIAAAGKHNILFCGPPGTGKTMLARRLLSILPPLSEEQALTSASIHSISGEPLNLQNWLQRPFRSPHHTCSAVAIAGGGHTVSPGEVSLAHQGILFLDELPEFGRRVLDVLREPLESHTICIARANQKVTFPADFQLVAAMNPSPTGDLHDGRSSNQQIARYLAKISGPLLDRIDIQVDVPKLPIKTLIKHKTRADSQYKNNSEDHSATIRQRVIEVQARQLERQGCLNSQLSLSGLQRHCALGSEQQQFIASAMEKLKLSARSYHRVLKVARTISDLEHNSKITTAHLSEALGYRSVERMIAHIANQQY